MPSSRPSWPDLLDPTFRKIYGDEIRQLPQMVFSIFNTDSSVKNIEKDSSASGLSKLVNTPEGGAITYEDEVEGFNSLYTHQWFAKGTAVSKLLWEDDQFGVMRRKPKNLADAKIRTQEQFGADVLNNSFTYGGGGTAPFNGPDGVALFSASHPREDNGASQGNYSTADISEDSLESAIINMVETLDAKGQLFVVDPQILLVPPALEKEAHILMDSVQRTGTTNNDINAYKGRLEIRSWKYLSSVAGGSDTAWFIYDPAVHELNWFNRSDSGLEGPEWDFDTKTAKWSVDARWSAGWSGWRGMYGSKGDNS